MTRKGPEGSNPSPGALNRDIPYGTLSTKTQTNASGLTHNNDGCAGDSSKSEQALEIVSCPPVSKELGQDRVTIVINKDVQTLLKMDARLKRIIKRQIPYLVGGAITGIVITYYYGFLFSLIVNSLLWTAISFAVNKFYYEKRGGFNDQRYLLWYAKSLIAPKR